MAAMAYAQARMQARFGGRPTPSLWRELNGIRDLGAYLDALGGSPLRHWVGGIGAEVDLHRIESTLRERYRAHVREVARWMPVPWQPSVLWIAELPDLPARAYLYSGRPPLAWMSRESGLRALIAEPVEGAAAKATLFPDVPGSGRRGDVPAAAGARAAWLAEWKRRWPAGAVESRLALQRTVTVVSAHVERFRRDSASGGWRLREALERDLRALFRRFALRPEACFTYLGLIALDLERLRAQLVRRALWRLDAAA